MSSVLDDVLVGLVLLASAGYAIASLGPRTLRARMLAALSRALSAAPAFLGLGRAAHAAEAAALKARGGAGGCGGCDNCGAEPSAAQGSSAEIKVPVEKIGRRS
jgi:hypothetical protein